MRIENMSSYIKDMFFEYSEDVNKQVKKAVETVATETNKVIKAKAPKKKGAYIKAFRMKDTSTGKRNHGRTWYVAAPHYRLTHLLENGHLARSGKRSRAFPHIKSGEDYAKGKLTVLIQKAVEDAGK